MNYDAQKCRLRRCPLVLGATLVLVGLAVPIWAVWQARMIESELNDSFSDSYFVVVDGWVPVASAVLVVAGCVVLWSAFRKRVSERQAAKKPAE